MELHARNRLALLVILGMSPLAGCTTYTWEDGRQETVWGIPAEEETTTREERQTQGIEYREPGEVPE